MTTKLVLFLSVLLLALSCFVRADVNMQFDWEEHNDMMEQVPPELRNLVLEQEGRRKSLPLKRSPEEEKLLLRISMLERQLATMTARIITLERRISKTHPLPSVTPTPSMNDSPSPTPGRESVTASIASKRGNEAGLKLAIQSMQGQVDRMYVYLDGYSTGEPLPTFLHGHKWVIVAAAKQGDEGLPRLTGKWFWANKIREGYHFLLEDTLVYPKNYVEVMIEKIESFNRIAVVGIKGDILTSPFEDYESSAQHILASQMIEKDIPVHILRTGTLAYHTSTLQFPEYNKIFRAMGDYKIEDLVISLIAQRAKLPLISISHEASWVRKIDSTKVAYFEELDVALATAFIKNTRTEWKRYTVKKGK